MSAHPAVEAVASQESPAYAGAIHAKVEEYRAHVGPVEFYDLLSAIQFNLVTALGLREGHSLLDIGCGSLRAGRLFIPYLAAGNYFGLEPLPWLVEAGIGKEIGASMVSLKRPTFRYDEDFSLGAFGRQFDFILAQSIFSHTSQAQIQRCMLEAKRTLKPGGLLVATYFEASMNYQGNHWVVKANYTRARMRELVEEQGLEFTPIEWRHPDPQQWFVAHHPGIEVPLAIPSEASRMRMLEEQLATQREQLLRITSHPYVRLGQKLQPFLIWMTFTRRRIARAVSGKVGR
ncbi:MAG: class I SAM-dependent methyltransferase [Propionivibrio sp.]|uniref:Class I SAM-dependent methyltransferase n=1 Tax=Candidatus Propionivibrio dominans TaxID=2954373 RepID=A0A9D7IDT7_9RHOO|nr:class I SAM-dependent methyltransferase [Candidatus Propionivibrio dominans]MBL0167314.1 class I SAM-dependent methyltransferase [Propionivibrio sp.]